MPKRKYTLGFKPPAGPTRRPMQKRIRETRAEIEKRIPASAKAKLAGMRPAAPSGGHAKWTEARRASRKVERKGRPVEGKPGKDPGLERTYWPTKAMIEKRKKSAGKK